jgi:hypothetical protein
MSITQQAQNTDMTMTLADLEGLKNNPQDFNVHRLTFELNWLPGGLQRIQRHQELRARVTTLTVEMWKERS